MAQITAALAFVMVMIFKRVIVVPLPAAAPASDAPASVVTKADGAAVTIKVIDQEEVNALTVPIAAVKQNGSGQDVVRVIDLANRGKVREMPVQTGLTEGSYIEIKKGLTGRETVIVEVDQPQ